MSAAAASLARPAAATNIGRELIAFEENDASNPRAWPHRTKMLNVAVIAAMAILSPLASSMFTPGIDQIAEGLDTTYGTAGALSWQSESEKFGGLGSTPFQDRSRDLVVLSDVAPNNIDKRITSR